MGIPVSRYPLCGVDDEPTDAAVVRRVLAGEMEAYAILVARYRVRLGRFAGHMLGNREDAEDALQETFVRAYRSLARCDNPERFGAWLYQILANRCRTRWARRRRRNERVFVDDGALRMAAVESRTLERLSFRDAVHRALAQLEPDAREAFLLKHVEELSYEEMAALTEVGVSALKMRVKRACERLREVLGSDLEAFHG